MKTIEWSVLAETIVRRFVTVAGRETLSLEGATGRILAEPLFASNPLPSVTHAVMDGYALGSAPPGLYTIMDTGVESLSINEASPVIAGGAIPASTSGVVLSDHSAVVDGKLQVSAALSKSNIRRAGEEAGAGDLLLPAGTRLDARHLALAAASGVTALTVIKRPRIALVGLHDGAHAFPHLALMLDLLNSPAVHISDVGVVRHHLLAISLERLALSHDLIVVVAESLGAEGDAIETTIKQLGGKCSVSRAALKPAKPLILGQIGSAQIMGLAGTAFATTIAAHLFLRPALLQMLGLPQDHQLIPVKAGFERSRTQGRAEALPMRIMRENQNQVVMPAGRFGQLRALAAMDGFALVSSEATHITSGMSLLFRKLSFPLI